MYEKARLSPVSARSGPPLPAAPTRDVVRVPQRTGATPCTRDSALADFILFARFRADFLREGGMFFPTAKCSFLYTPFLQFTVYFRNFLVSSTTQVYRMQ